MRVHRWPWYVAALLLLALFGVLIADVSHHISKGNFGSFITYYHAAGRLKAGLNPYSRWGDGYRYVYPPLFAFLCRPLLSLNPPAAARVALIIDASALLLALLVCARMMLRRFSASMSAANIWWMALATAVITIIPIHNELRGLETNSIMLLGFSLALNWLDDLPWLAGLPLAIVINIKYLPVVTLPYLLLRRRWVATASVLVWTVAVALLPAVSLGWSANLRYLGIAESGLINLTGANQASGAAHVHDVTDESSVSATSALIRLSESAGWPRAIGWALTAAIMIACGATVAMAYRKRGIPVLAWPAARAQASSAYKNLVSMEWAGLIVATLAFSPNTQDRHLLLAALPATLAVFLVFSARSARGRVLTLIATLLLLAALTLPISNMGHHYTTAWRMCGAPSYLLLAAFGLLLRAGLDQSEKDRSVPDAGSA